MSSTIKLYEHNQKTYDALLDMLGERDRACIIKPTGTGKFVIIAKMVQDNPDKRFLLLGTNDYMFNDQMANLAEIAPGFTPENLQFMTYSAAMMAARRGEEISSYDVVVADEFHHCGAEEWGKGVTHILDANESAKVVGFSATPIRYSDGGRNMADEMCDRRISQLTGRKPRGAGVRACEERVSGMAGTQGRPLYDGLRLHGLGDRYEQHLLRHRDHRSSSER